MPASPNWQRAEAAKAAPQLQRLQDFFDGTDAVRARSKTYVPQLEKESDKNYALRSTGVAALYQQFQCEPRAIGWVFECGGRDCHYLFR